MHILAYTFAHTNVHTNTHTQTHTHTHTHTHTPYMHALRMEFRPKVTKQGTYDVGI